MWFPEFTHSYFFYRPHLKLLLFRLLLVIPHSQIGHMCLDLRMSDVDAEYTQVTFEVFKPQKAILFDRLEECCQILVGRMFDVDGGR